MVINNNCNSLLVIANIVTLVPDSTNVNDCFGLHVGFDQHWEWMLWKFVLLHVPCGASLEKVRAAVHVGKCRSVGVVSWMLVF